MNMTYQAHDRSLMLAVAGSHAVLGHANREQCLAQLSDSRLRGLLFDVGCVSYSQCLLLADDAAITFLAQLNPLIEPRRGNLRPHTG